MSVVFNMDAVSVLPTRVQADGTQLTHALEAAATDVFILHGDYQRFLGGHASDGWFHAVIRDATRKEIIKVNVAGSSPAAGLQVERGQQGTTAVNWQPGAAIYQDITASDLQNMLQKEVFRTVDYIPDGVLVPDYRGEKVYQSDLQLWWKAVDGVNTYWRLIAGEIVMATPTLAPVAGVYLNGQSVTIECVTAGAIIYYTLDGTDPTDESTEYVGPVALPDFATTTVKAIAYGPERYYTPSAITSTAYTTVLTRVATPSISPAAGAYLNGRTVTITCATSGATIHYTIDGSDPSSGSALYTGAITLPNSATTTVKAIGHHADVSYYDSEIASAVYTTSQLYKTGSVAFDSQLVDIVASCDGFVCVNYRHPTLSTAQTIMAIPYDENGALGSPIMVPYKTVVIDEGLPTEVTHLLYANTGFHFDGEILVAHFFSQIVGVSGDFLVAYSFNGVAFTEIAAVDISSGDLSGLYRRMAFDGEHYYAVVLSGGYSKLTVFTFNRGTLAFAHVTSIAPGTLNFNQVICDSGRVITNRSLYGGGTPTVSVYTFNGASFTLLGSMTPPVDTYIAYKNNYMALCAWTSALSDRMYEYYFNGSSFSQVGYLDDSYTRGSWTVFLDSLIACNSEYKAHVQATKRNGSTITVVGHLADYPGSFIAAREDTFFYLGFVNYSDTYTTVLNAAKVI